MTLVNLPVTIGIVDDHKLFRQGIRQILNRFDDYHLLFEAASCQELLEVLSQQQPNVLLMDLQMPDMDGLEGCKRVLEQYPTIKIIVISMHTADSFVFHTLKMGARSYLPKDIDQQTLRAAIDEVMTKGYYFTDQVANVARLSNYSQGEASVSGGHRTAHAARKRGAFAHLSGTYHQRNGRTVVYQCTNRRRASQKLIGKNRHS
jgi:DNA-binding NarL/FixJ family response regulator